MTWQIMRASLVLALLAILVPMTTLAAQQAPPGIVGMADDVGYLASDSLAGYNMKCLATTDELVEIAKAQTSYTVAAMCANCQYSGMPEAVATVDIAVTMGHQTAPPV